MVGETLSFMRNPFRFVAERFASHGPVFRTRLLGRDVAVISGPDACALWLDEQALTRDGAAFDHVLDLSGGATLRSLDGAAHRTRQAHVAAAFDDAALEHYVPGIERCVSEELDLWAAQGEVRWLDGLRSLAIGVIADSVLGLSDPESIDGLVASYEELFSGFVALPVALPGSTLQKAQQARDRVLEFMRECVAESRQTPYRDGLSRILAHTDANGQTIDDEAAALEAHHLFVAGYVVFAELAGLVLRLHNNQAVRVAVADEVNAHAAEGPLSRSKLDQLQYLKRVVLEVKRITPILPILFARAKKAIPFAGSTIPQGWQVSLALHQSQMLDSTFASPDRFDPDRFSDERAEHRGCPHAFTPHGPRGATGHRCPGVDYSTYFMMIFAVLLVRDYAWELPKQDLSYDHRRVPPEPRDGLRAKLSRLHVQYAPRRG